MSTLQEFRDMTKGLGVESDCPVCGFSWPGCQGLCVSHKSMTGNPGPYHSDYNDDCEECKKELGCPACGIIGCDLNCIQGGD